MFTQCLHSEFTLSVHRVYTWFICTLGACKPRVNIFPVHMDPFSSSHGPFLQFTWNLSPVHMEPFSIKFTRSLPWFTWNLSPVHMEPFSSSHGPFLQFTWNLSPSSLHVVYHVECKPRVNLVFGPPPPQNLKMAISQQPIIRF